MLYAPIYVIIFLRIGIMITSVRNICWLCRQYFLKKSTYPFRSPRQHIVQWLKDYSANMLSLILLRLKNGTFVIVKSKPISDWNVFWIIQTGLAIMLSWVTLYHPSPPPPRNSGVPKHDLVRLARNGGTQASV